MITAFFRPGKVGTALEVLNGVHGDLIAIGDPTHYRGPAPFTGETLDAIRAAQHITPSPKALALAAAAIKASQVPKSITPAQLRLQLAADGKQSADVESIISHLAEPLKTQATIMFEYSLQFDRANALLIQLGAALGYDTSAKLDAFFIAAAAR